MPRDHALRVLDRDDGLRALVLVARILEPAVVGRVAIPFLEAAFDVDRRAAALYRFAGVVPRCGLQGHEVNSRRHEQSPRPLFETKN